MKASARKGHLQEAIAGFTKGTVPAAIEQLPSLRPAPSTTVVLSGFWRSGTTWLQEATTALLSARSIYEPFHPWASCGLSAAHERGRDSRFLELFMPYWSTSGPENPLVEKLVARSLGGDLPGRAPRVLRNNLFESFRPRVVVKFVRAHLCLERMSARFDPPIIHVTRDPRAILASILMTDWSWMFDHLSLVAQLLDTNDGRRGYFQRWQNEIREYDRHGRIAKIAAYWALTERFVIDSVGGGRSSRVAFVTYESLCQDPAKIRSHLVGIGSPLVSPQSADTLGADSFSTSAERRGISTDQRIWGWKHRLAAPDVLVVENIARQFGLESKLL